MNRTGADPVRDTSPGMVRLTPSQLEGARRSAAAHMAAARRGVADARGWRLMSDADAAARYTDPRVCARMSLESAGRSRRTAAYYLQVVRTGYGRASGWVASGVTDRAATY